MSFSKLAQIEFLFELLKVAKNQIHVFFSFFKLAKIEIHVFGAFLSLQKLKFKFLQASKSLKDASDTFPERGFYQGKKPRSIFEPQKRVLEL